MTVTVTSGAGFALLVIFAPLLPAEPMMTPTKNRPSAEGITTRFLAQAGRAPGGVEGGTGG
ncbi:hypothetical protein [Streptomyces anulatus]|uniref:hypothetical protein n=1 Tax=Streptomyces anulatus TaxID=1892 RepID=UPI003661525E